MASPNQLLGRAREIRAPSVQFLYEQDGPPERVLKSQLVELFKRNVNVKRAYLARISSGDQSSVALCARMKEALIRTWCGRLLQYLRQFFLGKSTWTSCF